MELTDKQKRKLLSVAEIVYKGDMVVLEKLLEFEDFIEEKEQKINEVITKVEENAEALKATIDTRLSEVKNGENYVLTDDDMSEIASKVTVPVVEKIIQKTETIIEKPTVTNKIVEVAVLDPNVLPQYGEKFRDGLELLEGNERLAISAIKDLQEKLDALNKKIKDGVMMVGGGSSGGGRIVKSYDLSPLLNGVLKTFTIPAMWRLISVHSSSFPTAFRETIDYTWTPQSITFTSEIEASTTLATGQTLTIIYSE